MRLGLSLMDSELDNSVAVPGPLCIPNIDNYFEEASSSQMAVFRILCVGQITSSESSSHLVAQTRWE